MAKKENQTTEGQPSVVITVTEEMKGLNPSLASIEVGTEIQLIQKDEHNLQIKELTDKLNESVALVDKKDLEIKIKDELITSYEEDLNNLTEAPADDKYSHVPEVLCYGGEKFTKEQIIADKKLLEILKK